MYFESFSAITQTSLEELSNNNGYLLVYVAEKSATDVEPLIALFNQHGIKLFGGIYPTLIQDTKNYDEGILTIKIPAVERVLKFLVNEETTFQQIDNFEEINTAFLLTDGKMAETDSFLRKVYSLFGSQMNIVGGGAGFLKLQQQPCLFTNDGVFQDGAVMALLKNKSKIGVKHGWDIFEGPFIATATEKNIIKELNWRPAFEVYQEVIEANSDKVFTENNFLDIAKNFPFGIHKAGTEFVVRDPIALNEANEITCISEVPENSTLQILTGDPDTLIQAAKDVAEQTYNSENTSKCLIIFDCITRVMYLDDRFEDELKAMQEVYHNNDCKIRGVATLGEIASSGTGFVDFYNKTIVACSLYC
jgi:hypothetical protein